MRDGVWPGLGAPVELQSLSTWAFSWNVLVAVNLGQLSPLHETPGLCGVEIGEAESKNGGDDIKVT